MSFISPHKAISSQSVSRWLSRALRMAGIELTYTGHSTRGASTSAAAAAGLSADLILEAADWASVQTFEGLCYFALSYLQEAFIVLLGTSRPHLASCSIIKLLRLLFVLVLFAWQYCFGILHQYCDHQSERGEGEIIFPRRVTYLTGRCGSPNPS